MREKLGLEDSWKKKEERKKEYNRKTFDSIKDRINVGIWPSIAS